MPSSKDVVSGRRGGGSSSSNKKNAFCSFCRKSYRDVGPLVEGPEMFTSAVNVSSSVNRSWIKSRSGVDLPTIYLAKSQRHVIS